jgi:hypothetical protein
VPPAASHGRRRATSARAVLPLPSKGAEPPQRTILFSSFFYFVAVRNLTNGSSARVRQDGEIGGVSDAVGVLLHRAAACRLNCQSWCSKLPPGASACAAQHV